MVCSYMQLILSSFTFLFFVHVDFPLYSGFQQGSNLWPRLILLAEATRLWVEISWYLSEYMTPSFFTRAPKPGTKPSQCINDAVTTKYLLQWLSADFVFIQPQPIQPIVVLMALGVVQVPCFIICLLLKKWTFKQ